MAVHFQFTNTGQRGKKACRKPRSRKKIPGKIAGGAGKKWAKRLLATQRPALCTPLFLSQTLWVLFCNMPLRRSLAGPKKTVKSKRCKYCGETDHSSKNCPTLDISDSTVSRAISCMSWIPQGASSKSIAKPEASDQYLATDERNIVGRALDSESDSENEFVVTEDVDFLFVAGKVNSRKEEFSLYVMVHEPPPTLLTLPNPFSAHTSGNASTTCPPPNPRAGSGTVGARSCWSPDSQPSEHATR